MARQSGFRIKVELSGVNEALSGALDLADPKKRADLMKKAIRAGGRVLLKYMRAMMRKHDRTGWLRKNLISKLKYYKKQGTLVLILGVKSNATTTVTVRQRIGRNFIKQTKQITAHKYAHLVMFPRRQFTQQLTFRNRLGHIVTQQRNIGRYKGDNIIDAATQFHGAEALAAIRRVIENG